jgi:hypothetical protein
MIDRLSSLEEELTNIAEENRLDTFPSARSELKTPSEHIRPFSAKGICRRGTHFFGVSLQKQYMA